MVAHGIAADVIRLEQADGIATITLDRGGARNAIPVAGWHALAAAAKAVDDATLLVLRSADSVFSAGADLDELAALADAPDRRAPFRTAMRAGIDALAALPMPTVAMIDGGCFGAAVALVLACDLRIAGAGARFAIPPARLGIGYPAEDVARLVRQVGQGQAARLLFTAMPIDADEALRIGLVEAAGIDPAGIAANDSAALRALKAAIIDPDAPGHAAAFGAGFGSAAFARFAATRK